MNQYLFRKIINGRLNLISKFFPTDYDAFLYSTNISNEVDILKFKNGGWAYWDNVKKSWSNYETHFEL